MRDNDQTGSFDTEAFLAVLAETLAAGSFRLVLVLDKAPVELVRLVGYLESITDKLVIDLVALSAYDVGGSQILVPQRVDPEPRSAPDGAVAPPARQQAALVDGATDLIASIDQAKESERPLLRQLSGWAISLESEGLVKLSTYRGKSNRLTLLPRFPDEVAGLVTIYNDNGSAYVQVWESVFKRRAPIKLVLPPSIR